MLSNIRAGLASPWLRTNLVAVLGVLALLLMLSWRLGSSPAGLSPDEWFSVKSSNLGDILNNPLNAPYRLLQDLLAHLNHSIFLYRFTAVVFALVLAVSFYYLLRGWFGRPIALLSTVLLVFTPYFILASRSATPAIMFFIPALVLAAYSVASRNLGNRKTLILLVLSTGVAIYVPGMLWLILLMAAYRFSKLKDIAFHAELSGRYYALIALGFLILLAPLAVGLSRQPDLIRQLLLLPSSFPSVSEIGKDWLWALSAFFIQARAHQNLIIDRLPLLNAAQVGLLVFGGYVMWSRLRRELLVTIGLGLLIALLAGLNDDYSVLALALPLLMIMIGMGLRYLFIEWRHVFPLNPIAKAFAIGLMSLLVLTHVLFGIRYSLVAWPATVAAQRSHVLK